MEKKISQTFREFLQSGCICALHLVYSSALCHFIHFAGKSSGSMLSVVQPPMPLSNLSSSMRPVDMSGSAPPSSLSGPPPPTNQVSSNSGNYSMGSRMTSAYSQVRNFRTLHIHWRICSLLVLAYPCKGKSLLRHLGKQMLQNEHEQCVTFRQV